MDSLQPPAELSVSVGQEFRIEFEGYPGSGAMWRCVSDGGLVLIDQTVSAQDESIGSPVIQVFVFRADQPRLYQVSFELRREWEKSPRKRKEIAVTAS